ncbi:MAG TPA: exodeoxyribonuclease VII large subunit [Blastocatellia bacterium]|nr:exodeoxyribonuclease VII large subunit [Blastocatellia bacterium]
MSHLTFLERLIEQRRALSVSELTALVKILIEGQFIDVWVEGEVSNFRRHSSGHWYFTLKDEGAMLRAASFRMQNRLIRFIPEDGITVRARGRLSLYEARGEYQLLVEHLEPVGEGALQLAFEQLKARLSAEGLFDVERKRPLPLLPGRVGVVTSPTGAALRDILRVLGRRNKAVSVLIAPARVQGEGAPREIADAIESLNDSGLVDVIIIGRGGGSIEDLWCFNDEIVARAIYNSRAPVISAVGHETDYTLADFVADLRASTPSAAAEMVTMALDDAYAQIDGLTESLAHALKYRLLELGGHLSDLKSSRAFVEVGSRVRILSQRCDEAVYSLESSFRSAINSKRASYGSLADRLRDRDIRREMLMRGGELAVLAARLRSAAGSVFNRDGERLSVAAGKLESLSPLGVLSRGYAVAFDSEGRVIKNAAGVARGERVRVRLAEGEIDCTRD